MFSIIRTLLGTAAFLVAFPFIFIMSSLRRRGKREYGLTESDRDFEIARKFGANERSRVLATLQQVSAPEEKVLGAVVFLASNVEQIEDLVSLANSDRERLLNAATVKDERG